MASFHVPMSVTGSINSLQGEGRIVPSPVGLRLDPYCKRRGLSAPRQKSQYLEKRASHVVRVGVRTPRVDTDDDEGVPIVIRRCFRVVSGRIRQNPRRVGFASRDAATNEDTGSRARGGVTCRVTSPPRRSQHDLYISFAIQ